MGYISPVYNTAFRRGYSRRCDAGTRDSLDIYFRGILKRSNRLCKFTIAEMVGLTCEGASF